MNQEELYEKSIHTLELPTVLNMLADHCSSDAAKEEARKLRPVREEREIRKRLEETSAAKNMAAVRGDPSFTGLRDVRAALSRADLGGVLDTKELLAIAGVLRCTRTVKSYLADDGEGRTSIDPLFHALRPNRFLEEAITSAIPAAGEIADNASPELADIRRKMRAASERARDTLNRVISSPTYAKALQEPIITTRSGRYVVPVKSEYRNAIQGLVHDVSGSGSTLFIEPMGAVKANNELRELTAKEKTEMERILSELSARCAEDRDNIEENLSLLTRLDLIFAKADLSYDMKAVSPELSDRILFRRARHPLLPKDTAVPIDLELGGDYDTLVITGPNTGGKTVSLKTIGLLCAMAQCGLHIPVEDGSTVPVFQNILADIGDEQSIEQSLSTFSSHMTNIVEMLKYCSRGTLLLFDELGAGTDPTEGAALAVSIIEYARDLGAVIAATTHYAELKVYATEEKGVQNASCEFDVETLRPTYRLLVGIPGKSNAFAISSRLGLNEKIIRDAKTRIGTENATFEATIEKLEQTRHLLEAEREAAAEKTRQAEADRREAARLRAELSVRLEKADEKTEREARRILEQARRTAEQTYAELDAMRKTANRQTGANEENNKRTAILKEINDQEAKLGTNSLPEKDSRISARPLRPGDTAEIKSMGTRGIVESVSKDRTVELRVGAVLYHLKEDKLLLIEGAKPDKPKPQSLGRSSIRHEAVPAEIDLRGMDSIDAVMTAERYIDDAFLARMESVTIIHGKGTGALRRAIQEMLKKNKNVKSFRLGTFGEGEAGVTVVTLR
jgi:DNA mismatch repair protein MutS2